MNVRKQGNILLLATLLLLGTAVNSALAAYNITDLGTLGGLASRGYDINNAGQVVGEAYTGGATHAFHFNDGMMTDLGNLGAISQ